MCEPAPRRSLEDRNTCYIGRKLCFLVRLSRWKPFSVLLLLLLLLAVECLYIAPSWSWRRVGWIFAELTGGSAPSQVPTTAGLESAGISAEKVAKVVKRQSILQWKNKPFISMCVFSTLFRFLLRKNEMNDCFSITIEHPGSKIENTKKTPLPAWLATPDSPDPVSHPGKRTERCVGTALLWESGRTILISFQKLVPDNKKKKHISMKQSTAGAGTWLKRRWT